MKIVLDTNCLLQIIFPQSYPKEVWDAFFAQQYVLCFTNEILLEYREIIGRRVSDILQNLCYSCVVNSSTIGVNSAIKRYIEILLVVFYKFFFFCQAVEFINETVL